MSCSLSESSCDVGGCFGSDASAGSSRGFVVSSIVSLVSILGDCFVDCPLPKIGDDAGNLEGKASLEGTVEPELGGVCGAVVEAVAVADLLTFKTPLTFFQTFFKRSFSFCGGCVSDAPIGVFERKA